MNAKPTPPPGFSSQPHTPSKHQRVPSLHTSPFTSPRRASTPDTSSKTCKAADTTIGLAIVGNNETVNRDEVKWLVGEMLLAQKAHETNKRAPVEMLRAEYMLHREEVLKWEKQGLRPEKHKVDNKCVNVFSWDGFHECKKELDSLEVVRTFGDLRCPHRHVGEQVRARIISSPIARQQVMMYIEDIHGATLPLTITFPILTVTVVDMTEDTGKNSNPWQDYYKCLFSVGQNIAVREPLVKLGVQGEYAMQVDKISDIVLLPSASMDVDWRYPVPKAALDIFNAFEMDYDTALKTGRSDIADGGQYDRAIITFTKSLTNPSVTEDPIKHATLLLERSRAFNLALKRGPAYRDAGRAFNIFTAAQDPTNAGNALLSMAQASYHLRLYTKTARLIALLELTLQPLPDDFIIHIKKLQKKMAHRQAEAKHGLYDWKLMYDVVCCREGYAQSSSPDVRDALDDCEIGCLDVADYSAPITPQEGGRCGRGLVTTLDVKAGELLLVSKAIIRNWPADLDGEDDDGNTCSHEDAKGGEDADIEDDVAPINFCLEHQADNILPQLDAQAVELLIYELDNNPAVGHILAGLSYSGNPSPATFPDLNLSMTEDEQVRELIDANKHQINITELHRIYHNNYFSGPMIHKSNRNSSSRPDPGQRGKHAEMLFGLPSLVNHSCLPNASVTFWDDVVVFRALSDLRKGTEVLISYIPTGYPRSARLEFLSLQWDLLQCECILCQADRKGERNAHLIDDSDHKGKEDFSSLGVDPYADSVDSGRIEVERYKRMRGGLQKQMDKARARGRLEPILDLASSWANLSLYVPNLDIMEIIHCRKQALICTGFVFTDPVIHDHNRLIHRIVIGDDSVISVMKDIAILYSRLRNFDELRRWVQGALWVHNIHFGGGPELFKMRWSNFTVTSLWMGIM